MQDKVDSKNNEKGSSEISSAAELKSAMFKIGIAGMLFLYLYISKYADVFSENIVYTMPIMTMILGFVMAAKERKISLLYAASGLSLILGLVTPYLVQFAETIAK